MNSRNKIAMICCYTLVFGALALMVAACVAPSWMIEVMK